MPPPILFLGVPSALILLLLFVHSLKNRGERPTFLFFAAAILYGILRAFLIQRFVTKQPGTLFPYLMNFPVLKIGAVSVQEIVGWSVAAAIPWFIGDRLLRVLKITPGPYRTALAASVVLMAICLAVETAAIEAGWWIWTIKQLRGIFGRVPLVGIMDWGFVAFDFLLPYLLWISPAPLLPRLISLSLFPIHFLFHAKTNPLPEPLPLAWNDLAHAAIFSYVVVQAIGDRGKSAFIDPGSEKLKWIPTTSVAIIAVATSLAIMIDGKDPIHLLASLPVLIFGLAAYLPKSKPAVKKSLKKEEDWGQFLWKLAAVMAIFCFVYALRAPFNRRTQAFAENMKRGIEYFNRGDLTGAEQQIRKGMDARPDQASGHALLAHVLLTKGELKPAREQLEIALDLNQTQQTALILLSTVDLMEKKWAEAAQRSVFGHRLYPDRPEFIYQQAMAEHKSVAQAIDVAKRGGPGMIQALANVAIVLGDRSTAEACSIAIAEMQRSRSM